MAYCSTSLFVSLIAGLRASSSSLDLNDDAILGILQDAADKITGKMRLNGFAAQTDTEIEILARANPSQLLLLEAANGLKALSELIQNRAQEIDTRYFTIAESHKEFLEQIYNWLAGVEFLSAFDSQNPNYPISTLRPQSNSVAFTGTGDNNLTATVNFTGFDDSTFTIIIQAGATTFKWKKDAGALSSAIAITGAPQLLSDGVYITIPAGSHIATDQWILTILLYASPDSCAPFVPGWKYNQAECEPSRANANIYINWATCVVYALAARFYRLANLNQIKARKLGDAITQLSSAIIIQCRSFRSPRGELDVAAYARIKASQKIVNDLITGQFNQIFIN